MAELERLPRLQRLLDASVRVRARRVEIIVADRAEFAELDARQVQLGNQSVRE